MTQVGPPIPDDRLVNLAASEIDSSDKFSVESTAPDPLPPYIFGRCTKPVAGTSLHAVPSMVLQYCRMIYQLNSVLDFGLLL